MAGAVKIDAFIDPREAVATITGRLGWSLAATSRAIDADVRFLDRFVREGRPRELAPPVRRRLARILDTDERNLMPRGGIGVYDGFYDPRRVRDPHRCYDRRASRG